MSKRISPPLSSLPASRPLNLSLSHLELPAQCQSDSAGMGSKQDWRDLLDELDAEEGDHLLQRPSHAKEAQRSEERMRKERGELSDWTRVLFPSHSDHQTDEQEPSWTKSTRRRIKTMTAFSVPPSHANVGGEEGEEEMSGGVRREGRGERRVLLGCEDGSLFIFGRGRMKGEGETPSGILTPLSNAPSPSPFVQPSNDINSLANSNSRSSTSPPTPSTTRRNFTPTKLSLNGRPIIPPYSPPPSSTTGSRRFSEAGSILSSSDLASSSTTPGVAGVGGSGGRSRKASATVSVSVPVGEGEEGSFASLGSPVLDGFGFGSPGIGETRGHRRGKESITSGIGLWEIPISPSSPPPSLQLASPAPSIAFAQQYVSSQEVMATEGGITATEGGTITTNTGVTATEEEREELSGLEMMIRVELEGEGEVVEVRIVEGLRFAREEGAVGVVLRADGTLSIHSFLDGRSFGVVNASAKIPISLSSTGPIAFSGFEILVLDHGIMAICYLENGKGIIVVDLDNLEAQSMIELDFGKKPIVVHREGAPILLTTPPSSSHLISRSISLTIPPPEPKLAPVKSKAVVEKVEDKGNSKNRIQLGEPIDLGDIFGLSGDVQVIRECGGKMVGFDERGNVVVFKIDQGRIDVLARFETTEEIVVVEFSSSLVVLITRSSTVSFTLTPSSSDSSEPPFEFVELMKQDTQGVEASCMLDLGGERELLVARSDVEERFLEKMSLRPRSSEKEKEEDRNEESVRRLYSVPRVGNFSQQITSNVKIDRERLILGSSSGDIYELAYSNPIPKWKASVGSAIVVLKVFDLDERGKVVVVGCVDGSAAAWGLSDWSLIASWSLFASPITEILHLAIPSSPLLRNTLLLISSNSPIALITLTPSPPTLLSIFPGTRSRVESVSTDAKGGELLVIYANGLARVCVVEAQELRRSMDVITARKVLEEGGWKTWYERSDLRALGGSDSILTFDLRHEIDTASQMLPWSTSTSSTDSECDLTASTKNSREHLGLVRFLLAEVMTFGIDDDCDRLLGELGVKDDGMDLRVGLQSVAALSIMRCESVIDPWIVSPTATAQRLLYIVCLLRVYLNFPDTEQPASQAIAFFASFLCDSVGLRFIFPSLDVFADYYLDRSNEVQQAARLLFGSYLASADDNTIVELAERWQDLLPSRVGEKEPHYGSADQAVLIIGLIASDKFKLLSAATLKDVSLSISTYLADSSSTQHQQIALLLLTQSFELFQNYLDAMSIVRQLFGLATGKNGETPVELRNAARAATVVVASCNTPLFITTLSFDILNATEVEQRNATLKLLGFMVRKKPLVLYTSLPRLAEAVVKSLDPTVTALRETVHQAATVILNELVRTYPSIDFHHRSQRLAVGTHEGATIVYDLRTATRLYVLEGHQKPITALSWSPDGRRLVSTSLEESKVVVWKVGVGILSMFSPGVPPSGGVPFKVLEFAVGDEGLMTTAATLEWVGFEWPTDRTARLRIRETTLTFNV